MRGDRSAMRMMRHKRIRSKISGNATRPRMSVFRSAKHIFVQLIDDVKGRTLVAASTTEKTFKDLKNKATCDGAKHIGQIIAERAKALGIQGIVFDRGGYLFHGRVKALADSAREHGLKF